MLVLLYYGKELSILFILRKGLFFTVEANVVFDILTVIPINALRALRVGVH